VLQVGRRLDLYVSRRRLGLHVSMRLELHVSRKRLQLHDIRLTTLITDTEGGKVAAKKWLMGWRREAGVFAEKIGRGNHAVVKAPIFTGKPKSTCCRIRCED
jgi:hypothetical protein